MPRRDFAMLICQSLPYVHFFFQVLFGSVLPSSAVFVLPEFDAIFDTTLTLLRGLEPLDLVNSRPRLQVSGPIMHSARLLGVSLGFPDNLLSSFFLAWSTVPSLR